MHFIPEGAQKALTQSRPKCVVSSTPSGLTVSFFSVIQKAMHEVRLRYLKWRSVSLINLFKGQRPRQGSYYFEETEENNIPPYEGSLIFYLDPSHRSQGNYKSTILWAERDVQRIVDAFVNFYLPKTFWRKTMDLPDVSCWQDVTMIESLGAFSLVFYTFS